VVDETSPSAAESSWRNRLIWPGMIIALLVLHILAVVSAVFVATRDRSFAVEPNYYQKALHWEDTLRQREANQRLAWQVALELGGDRSTGQRLVSCRLSDSQGRPLEGGLIDLVAFAHARGNDRFAAVLEESTPGRYEGAVRMPRGGTWEFRLVIHRGPETFTYEEQRKVE